MSRHRIVITGKDREAMLDLVRKHKIGVLDHANRHAESTGYVIHAIAETAEIQELKKAGYEVQQLEDVDATGKARQQEVGRGDRYKRPTTR
jgi:carboxypeptidase T